MKHDLETTQDIEIMVHSFYEQIRNDALLGPIFNDIIQDNWSKHLEKMCRFWETVLLGSKSYFGSPFRPHAQMPIRSMHFKRWRQLFNQCIDDQFCGQKVEEAKWRADKMAEMFLMKIEHYQKVKVRSII